MHALEKVVTYVCLLLILQAQYCVTQSRLRPVHSTMVNNALRCIVFASTLVETQHAARIDSIRLQRYRARLSDEATEIHSVEK